MYAIKISKDFAYEIVQSGCSIIYLSTKRGTAESNNFPNTDKLRDYNIIRYIIVN